MKRKTFWASEKSLAALRELSEITDLTDSELMRRAIDEYIGRQIAAGILPAPPPGTAYHVAAAEPVTP